MRIGKPHTMEIAACIPFGAENFLGAPSHHFKTAVKCFKAGNTGILSVSDIVYLFPKIRSERSVCIFFNEIFQKQTGGTRRRPFYRRIPTRMKHQPVIHVIE